MAALSDMLVYLRKRSTLSQQELADKLGMTRSAIGMYETGKREPDLETLEVFADFYNVDMNTLTGHSSENVRENNFLDVTEDVVTFRVNVDIAAGVDQPASPLSDWEGASIDIPASYLRGRSPEDFFMIRINGDSMYPHYQNGDYVLVLNTPTLDHSGQIGVLLHGEEGTIKKIEYVPGEDWLRLVPLNPEFIPKTVSGPELETCRVIGVPKLIIREAE